MSRKQSRFTVAVVKVLILLTCFAGAVSTVIQPAHAQGGPPLLTDDPGTPGDGVWELNIAFTVENRRSERVYEGPLLDINYGVGERIQLKYEVPWLIIDESGEHSKSGLGNSMLGLKWRFFDENRQGIDMSVYPQFEFNTSSSSKDREIVDEGFELLIPFEIQKTFGPAAINIEVGYAVREHDDDEWIYGVAFGFEASERIELLGEVHGVAQQSFENDELVFNFGIRLKLSEELTLLTAAGRSFRKASSGEPELLLYTGTQLVF